MIISINLGVFIMTKTADRLKDVGFSATLKSKEIINRLKAAGEEVLGFTMGEPDFDTPPQIVDAAIKALHDGFTHYTASNGILELREAVAEKSKMENKISLEQIKEKLSKIVEVIDTKECFLVYYKTS